MFSTCKRNIIPTAFGGDHSPTFTETALFCGAVGYLVLLLGTGLAPNPLQEQLDLHGAAVYEAEGGEPSFRQRLVGILPKV